LLSPDVIFSLHCYRKSALCSAWFSILKNSASHIIVKGKKIRKKAGEQQGKSVNKKIKFGHKASLTHI
jgi:hypothetical protein